MWIKNKEITIINKIIKAVASVTLISVITRGLSFIFRIYLSRRLGAEALGLFQITFSIFMLFMCFSSSGLPVTLSRKTAEYTITDTKKLKSVFISTLTISAFIAIAIWLFFLLFPNILGLIFRDERCIPLFIAMLPCLVSTSIYCTIRSWFWGKREFNIYSTTELFEEVCKIILTIALLSGVFASLSDSMAVVVAFLITDYICAGLMIILFFSKGGKLVKPRHFKEVTFSSAPLTFTRVLASLTSSATALILPILLVKNGLTNSQATAEFGRLSGMAMPILMIPGTFIGALTVVLIPEIATANASGNKETLNKVIKKAMTFTNLITGFFLCVFFVFGQDIGRIVYHDSIAGKYIMLSAFIMLPMNINQLTISMLNSLGQESKTFITHLIGEIILIATIFLATKSSGILAYSISLMVFHCITLTLNSVLLHKKTKIKSSYLLDSGLAFTFSILFGLILKWIIKVSTIKINFLLLIVFTIFIFVMYTVFTFSTKIIHKDIIIQFIKNKKKIKKVS